MSSPDSDRAGTSRREFLRDAGAAGLVAAETLRATPAHAAHRHPKRHRRQTVAVFGGGVAGLTAAHELAERGFDVTVYERRAWGGKARSTHVPHSASGGRKPLPGEHGWRTFFGFYVNTVDTMRRIPFGSNPNGVFDNLVGAPQALAARDRGRRDLLVPLGVDSTAPRDYSPQQIIDLVVGALVQLHLPPDGVAYFASRLAVWLSSCDARRIGQWQNTTWTDYTRASSYGDDYRKILITTVSELVQASKADRTSAAFSAFVFESFAYNLLGRNSNGELFRFLNAPTNEALIDPWLNVLGGLGVKLRNHNELTRLAIRDGRITTANVRSGGRDRAVRADWYVCALPVERARRLWNRAILAADPELEQMRNLDTGWMNGMKFFLRQETNLARGLVGYVDSPWLVSSVSQAQFWPADFAATYGDGTVRESLSAVVSRWTAPGVLFGKPARDCTPNEIAREVWEQMKRHLNDTGETILTDNMLVSWNIDPGMLHRGDHLISGDPLVLPSVGSYQLRPDTVTRIPNLLLAGDYLNGPAEVANMEAASYNGRRATNAILEQAGSRAPPAAVIDPYRPPEWEALKEVDAQRYARGQPNLFDTDMTLDQLKGLLGHTPKLVGIQLQ